MIRLCKTRIPYKCDFALLFYPDTFIQSNVSESKHKVRIKCETYIDRVEMIFEFPEFIKTQSNPKGTKSKKIPDK
ncbi:hypothetical protein SynA18461_02334 [Synechococcus sp. A18-46.1]|nr:hypothetical protein SynA18461_02334 [Synechococcus sp. A18-46.1]